MTFHWNPSLFHELWAFSAGIWVVIFWPHFHGWRDKFATVMFALVFGAGLFGDLAGLRARRLVGGSARERLP